VRELARNLFSDHVFAFEFTSILLIVAVAGTVLLTRKSPKRTEEVDVRDRAARRLGPDHQLLPRPRRDPVRDRRRRAARATQPAHHVHVHRADAQRREPHFVAFASHFGNIDGQTAVFFVMVVAAAEVVVGLGIIISILRRRPGATADDLAELKG
jgi:hypothetical protein